MAHLGARAREARRRRSRPQDRTLERQPPAARRGPRVGTGCGRPGRAQPVRRPRAAWRSRRPVRGARNCGAGALAPGRSGSRGARRPGRGARPGRGREQCDPRRGRAGVAARPLAGCRPDPRRAPAGDRALGRSGRSARSRSRRRRRADPRLRASARRASATPSRQRGRDRDGHSRGRQEPRRGGVRRTRLRQAQPRRAWRDAARARSPAGGRAGIACDARRARQHLSHTRRRAATSSTPPHVMALRSAASGSTRRSRRRR